MLTTSRWFPCCSVPSWYDLVNSAATSFANTEAVLFRNSGWIPSGPGDLSIFKENIFLSTVSSYEFNGYSLCDFVCYKSVSISWEKNWLKLFSKYVGSFFVRSCPAAIRLQYSIYFHLNWLFCSNICIEFLLALFKRLNQFALIGQVILMDHGRNFISYFFIFLTSFYHCWMFCIFFMLLHVF